MATQKPLTRDQLAKFLPDHEAIKAFERLFQIVENLSPSDIAILTRMIEETGIEAGVADNKGDRAISNLAQVDAVEFNLNQNVAARIGQAKWNKADQTLDLRMEYGVTQQIGQLHLCNRPKQLPTSVLRQLTQAAQTPLGLFILAAFAHGGPVHAGVTTADGRGALAGVTVCRIDAAGKVVAGSDIVKKIEGVATGRKGFHDDVPKEDVVIEKAVAI